MGDSGGGIVPTIIFGGMGLLLYLAMGLGKAAAFAGLLFPLIGFLIRRFIIKRRHADVTDLRPLLAALIIESLILVPFILWPIPKHFGIPPAYLFPSFLLVLIAGGVGAYLAVKSAKQVQTYGQVGTEWITLMLWGTPLVWGVAAAASKFY